jgi:CheY-like chemotaxis protein
LALQVYGCEVEIAYDGDEAIDVARKSGEAFDAIVLDVEMPRMNGCDAARVIRELPVSRGAFIVLFTAFGDLKTMAQQAKEAGADIMLNKPMMPQELVEIIRQGVQERRTPGTATAE